MKKKLITALVLCLISLTGCSGSESPAKDPKVSTGSFKTTIVNVDGRDIPCITWKLGYAGGISCDWNK